jgi:hypothetical protein
MSSRVDPSAPPDLSADLVAKIPTWRAAYSDRTGALMAAFCQLAYVAFETDPPAPEPGDAPNPSPAGKALLAAKLATGGFTLVEVFNNKDTQAFLAISPDQFAVLAFRGTSAVPDWVTNLNALTTPLPEAPAVRVHRGFLAAFDCCKDAIVKAVDAFVPPELGLYITGHSLGGALAQIASAVLERDNLAACYTFGSPRVGTRGFDRLVKCPHYRLVNRWDIVPGVPPPWFGRVRHSGDPRLLTRRADEALRRERNGVIAFGIDLYALAVLPLKKSLSVVDDHMIWHYRTKLSDIALARFDGPASKPLK